MLLQKIVFYYLSMNKKKSVVESYLKIALIEKSRLGIITKDEVEDCLSNFRIKHCMRFRIISDLENRGVLKIVSGKCNRIVYQIKK